MLKFVHLPISAKLSAAVVAAGLALAPGASLAARYPHGTGVAHSHYYRGHVYPRYGYRYGPVSGAVAGIGALGGLAAGAVVGTLAAPFYLASGCDQYRPTYDQWGNFTGNVLVNVCG